jgi:hypothetical protein
VHEGQRQTKCPSTNAGSRLKRRPIGKALSDMPAFQPYWGKPPYGMIGGTVETSASYEARYAPLSYPTAGGALGNRRPYRDTGNPRLIRLG